MVTTKFITTVFIIATTLIVIAYDIFIVIEPSRGDTISRMLLTFSYRYPVIPWLWGILSGHLFWHLKVRDKKVFGINENKYRVIALIGAISLTVALIVLNCFGLFFINPCLLLLVGVVVGHYGWPQYIEGKSKWNQS